MRDSRALLPGAPGIVTRAFVPEEMLAPEQAVIAYLAQVSLAPPGWESVALDDALGRVLADDVRVPSDLPAHDRSTMDGFAVRSSDRGARRIAGEVRMGRAPESGLGAGDAMRIPTGGVLPDGADAVIPNEEVREEDGFVVPSAEAAAGDATTPRGSDMRSGELALGSGRRIGGPELGVLATLGYANVPVFRRPVFGVISTGDELVGVDANPAAGQVRDSNRYAIAGTLRAMGASVRHVPRVRDEPEDLRDALVRTLAECDGAILTGGSSVGARDLVPRVMSGLGSPGVVVHGIRLRPGKPTMLAALGGKPVFGLPGNPTSALIVLETVVRPMIAACTGERGARSESLEAIAHEPFTGRPGWTWYVPARVRAIGSVLHATPLRLHSAHASLLARATGYVVVGEYPARIEPGETVTVQRFSAGGAPVVEVTR